MKSNHLTNLLAGSYKDLEIEIVKWQCLEELGYFLLKFFLIIGIFYSYGKIIGYVFLVKEFFQLDVQIRFDEIGSYIISGFAIIPLFNLIKTFPSLWYSRTIKIFVNPQYIIYKQGAFNLNIEKIFLSNIDNIDFTRSLAGRIFNYGEIHLTNAGGTLSLKCVKNTKENYEKLKVLLDIRKEEETRV